MLSQRPLFQAGPEATGIRASDRRTISSSRSSTTPSTMPPVARRREVVTPRCPIATPQGTPPHRGGRGGWSDAQPTISLLIRAWGAEAAGANSFDPELGEPAGPRTARGAAVERRLGGACGCRPGPASRSCEAPPCIWSGAKVRLMLDGVSLRPASPLVRPCECCPPQFSGHRAGCGRGAIESGGPIQRLGGPQRDHRCNSRYFDRTQSSTPKPCVK